MAVTRPQGRPRIVATVRHDRGNGRASVAPLGAAAERVAAERAAAETFDPNGHTIDDVRTHIGDHPDQLDAVLEAERAGKARTTLIEWLESQAETDTEIP
jgi:hypothetical protein